VLGGLLKQIADGNHNFGCYLHSVETRQFLDCKKQGSEKALTESFGSR